MFYESYTGLVIKWPEAVQLVLDGRADMFVVIVEEAAKGSSEVSPCYGFFLRYEDGRLADVIKRTRMELMTTKLAHLAHSRLLEAYPDTWSFVLPAATAENVVKRGQILDQVTLRVGGQPRLGDPPEFF